MLPTGPEVKIIATQYQGVVLIPKQLHKYKPSWRALLAYYAIAYYSHNGSRSTENMTMRSLARVAAVSESTMLRGIEELKKKGALSVRHRHKKSSSGKRIPVANLYHLVNLDEAGDPL